MSSIEDMDKWGFQIQRVCPNCRTSFMQNVSLDKTPRCPKCGLIWHVLDFGKRRVIEGLLNGTFFSKVIKDYGKEN